MPMISGCPRVPSVAVGGETQGVNLLAFSPDLSVDLGRMVEHEHCRAFLSCFLRVDGLKPLAALRCEWGAR